MSEKEEYYFYRKDNYSTSSADIEYASENEVEEQSTQENLPVRPRDDTSFKSSSRERSEGSDGLSSSPESPVTTENRPFQELQKQKGEMSPKAAQEEILAQIQRLQLKLTELREVDSTSSIGSHQSHLQTTSSSHSSHQRALESSLGREANFQVHSSMTRSNIGETGHDDSKLGPKLLVVSNRLPVTVTRDNNGTYHFNMSSGGLVSALKGVKSLMSFIWIGWPGTEIDPNEREYVRNKLREDYSCFPVFITDEQANLYYNGFCNDVLWPLFHYVPVPIVSSDGERKFDFKYWQAYSAANYRFAEAVLQVYQEGDYIWVQDYHLLLLPSLLRRRLRDVKIGFFLHIPFPTSEVYRILPVRKELLQGVLAADLIGFHTYDYARHFLSVCTRILGLDSSPKGVNYHSHFAHVGIFPIGIDPNTFHRALEDSNVQQRIQELHEKFIGKKVLLGVDRLDYIKGVPHKLLALEWLLTKHSEWMHKVVLVQIAVPTRTEIEEYKKLSSQTNELVGRINGKFGTVDHSPIMFINQSLAFEELVALYTVADVAIVSSVRDGMNLVSYEYVMCQQANKGVLILSEFAGSAQSLSGAIRVNPWNIEELANAIHEALSMPRREREIKHWKLYRYVTTHTAEYWAKSFFQELDNVVKHRDELRLSLPLLNVKSVTKRMSNARIRLFLLEYEGSLCNSKSLAELNSPTSTHIKILTRLCSDPRNIVVILSGRSKDILEHWFGNYPMGLIAENGCDLKISGVAEWRCLVSSTETEWRDELLPVLQYFTERTPGAYIERKKHSITWHFRDADPEFGSWQANELQLHLTELCSSLPIEVNSGPKYLELRPKGVSRSSTVERLFSILYDEKRTSVDFCFCLGADRCSEDLFAFIHHMKDKANGDSSSSISTKMDAICCAVGLQSSNADAYLQDVEAALAALRELSSHTSATIVDSHLRAHTNALSHVHKPRRRSNAKTK
ncbi:hypothetical protein GAYE_PCTG32G0843 [Galdieria yellowstonensis]|uniref:alpha,alpha-trehalose-phosphate synthase (UDP-forming) n=1 Tax=Galdieria yellowstonensis TaxID=3028027 RepID=A0AAV9I6Z6_9RHOD|nr:hypothetical protein GAYE_PCTG32G0843 [Galdieria yellowstonensis]